MNVWLTNSVKEKAKRSQKLRSECTVRICPERAVESYPPKTTFTKISKILPLGLFNLLPKEI